MNKRFGNYPGMLVYPNRTIKYNGVFYNRILQDKNEKFFKAPKLQADEAYLNIPRVQNIAHSNFRTDDASVLDVHKHEDKHYGIGNTSAEAWLLNIKYFHLGQTLGDNDSKYSWAVVAIGDKHYPGDIVVILSPAKNDNISSAHLYNTSVIEVKANSLGQRIFNPSFKLQEENGKYILQPIGRYQSMWGELMQHINAEISQEKYQNIILQQIQNNDSKIFLSKFPLDVDFEDFVGRYASKNPFGPIEYLALGYNDDVTFYKLKQNPNLNLFGTGKNNQFFKRRADSIHSQFNSAYLSLRFRSDRKTVVGHVDFAKNGKLMASDNDIGVSFRSFSENISDINETDVMPKFSNRDKNRFKALKKPDDKVFNHDLAFEFLKDNDPDTLKYIMKIFLKRAQMPFRNFDASKKEFFDELPAYSDERIEYEEMIRDACVNFIKDISPESYDAWKDSWDNYNNFMNGVMCGLIRI